jgi:hypothetical protein
MLIFSCIRFDGNKLLLSQTIIPKGKIPNVEIRINMMAEASFGIGKDRYLGQARFI